MPVTQTTEAGQRLHNNATADRAARLAKSKRATDALNAPQDAPLETVGKAPLESLDTAPAAAPRPAIVLSVTIVYRGRQITISNDGMTLDQFCDLLDKRLGVAE